MMTPNFSCMGCTAPKRYPGCHGHCPEYLKERSEYEAKKAIADREKSIREGLYSQRSDAIAKIMRGRKHYGFQGKVNKDG